MTAMETRSWSDIRGYYLSFGEGPWRLRHQPMLDLIAWIEAEGLCATVGLSGLWISDRPLLSWGEHVLQIAMVTPERVQFEYHGVLGSTDGMRKTTPVAGAIECLRQFLAYKFGIHRPQKERANQRPEEEPGKSSPSNPSQVPGDSPP
jgi:hypothetical protein